MKNGDQPAFPDTMRGAEQSILNQTPHQLSTGLTKREYFAAMAMQGIISGYPNEAKVNDVYIPASDYAILTEISVQIAEALLKRLEPL